MRKFKELGDTVAAIRRLQATEGCQSVRRGRFLKALRKLEEAEQGKPVSGREIVRSISVISQVLYDELLKNGIVARRNEPSR